MKNKDIKKIVRENYGKVAQQESSCCGACGPAPKISQKIGYTSEELTAVPQGANLGLGCGNPTALASLKEGETVLDLGSGAGFDCFLAANKVGKKGKVIGIDMTPEMVAKAQENARKGNYPNVEFRLGDIEKLPVSDNSVDIVISNCVINLAPDKKQVFKEIFRVLKPGGRLMIADIVLLEKLPDSVRKSVEAYVGCLAGAVEKDKYLAFIKEAGFNDVEVMAENTIPIESMIDDPVVKKIMENLKMPKELFGKLATSIASARISGFKPVGTF